ncbi:hypothetical protein KIH74_35420 [Kineosporia sp. J2-2]|uniref:site-specific DNA-methyltransferase (adenine-specific) n=1 Tax=Kineosporia corallincola TaxID=2835133 RepID=A0ABS5TU00_9ACTN|nr:DNA methyltransferase [Kineosporia corallincola]MBT0774288.1 hypothetical protein [Kineosporia corallincola]
MNRPRTSARTGSDLHRAWLQLVDTDGPFLSVPALKRVWPQGMPTLDPEIRDRIRDAKPAFENAWDRWNTHHDDAGALDTFRAERDIWVDTVIRDVLGWGDLYTTQLSGTEFTDAAGGVGSQNNSVRVVPSGALARNGQIGALVLVIDPVDSLRDSLSDGWANSPVDRMEMLLKKADVPIGLVTDGRWWALVSGIREAAITASGIVNSEDWISEPATTAAFVELLQRKYLVGKSAQRLALVFKDSVAAAEEITEALGVQVRRAVELLVQSLSESAVTTRHSGQPDPLPDDRAQVYEAAVTVMMRVVFLLFAEERNLLPQSELFTNGYGVSRELDSLDQRARDEHTESLDSTHLTWHRLLATSLALYEGASFEDMRMPAYGGSLFDPYRFPFLAQRNAHGSLAVAVSDRVMLEVLRAVQMAQLKGQPAQRISFREIDVEQIGYIYEGLLGYSCEAVDEVIVGLIGSPGAEPEIPLSELEALAEKHATPEKLATALLASLKAGQPAAKPPTKAALAKGFKAAETVEDTDRALRSISDDENLRARLQPFIGVIRRDLRNRPTVFQPGGLVVIETPSRSSAGAHYTPRRLAEDVVEYALEPLVYRPGPHQTDDRSQWVLIPHYEITNLKIADIACGSGAFLVAAARRLGSYLQEAWLARGIVHGEARDQEIHAIRTVVAQCLYGADINAMAVEMCKLSLWLVSLDPKLPFSFVDDKVFHGNSLLGLTDVRQLTKMHIDPEAIIQDTLGIDTQSGSAHLPVDINHVLAQAVHLREALASEINNTDPHRSAEAKRGMWRDYQKHTAQLAEAADGVIAAGLRLGGKPGKQLDQAYENLRTAATLAYQTIGTPNRSMLEGILEAGLTPTVTTDYARWKPLHWILAVPDVLQPNRGGFDAVVGNPPFLGGKKISGYAGSNLREWLVNQLAGDAKGNADLVAYFFLRAQRLLNPRGTIGLIATNTLAQGDTREVGLDQMVQNGFTITRAVQSKSWPAASANLEYAAVWGTVATVPERVLRVCDDILVRKVSTLLEPMGRVEGPPRRLNENLGIAFIGCYVLGKGFVLDPSEARAWIADDPRNVEVLFPYLNGEDLNSRHDSSPSRWVVDFADSSMEKAARYTQPFKHLSNSVKGERATKAKAVRDWPWWQFWRARPKLRKALSDLDEVLVIALVSKTVMPMRVPSDQVFSHMLGVFATSSHTDQAVLSSSLHQTWAIKYGSGMRADPRYTPSDVFETFPRPTPTPTLDQIGRTLDTERREIMLRRDLGLTRLYNLVNDPDISNSDKDVARMREIHVELDEAVVAAYGWDVPLDHGFHTYRQMTRWSPSPAARVELMDLLLEENHRRAALQGEAPPPAETTDENDGDES